MYISIKKLKLKIIIKHYKKNIFIRKNIIINNTHIFIKK